MKTGRNAVLRSGDLLIYACILGLAVLCLLFRLLPLSETGALCVVIQTDREKTEYPLAEDRIIPVSSCGCSLEVRIADGTVSVVSADCPDRLCEKSEPVSRPGQSIVCLPAHTVIRITGKEERHDADIVLG